MLIHSLRLDRRPFTADNRQLMILSRVGRFAKECDDATKNENRSMVSPLLEASVGAR
jgi:hypothetical protein